MLRATLDLPNRSRDFPEHNLITGRLVRIFGDLQETECGRRVTPAPLVPGAGAGQQSALARLAALEEKSPIPVGSGPLAIVGFTLDVARERQCAEAGGARRVGDDRREPALGKFSGLGDAAGPPHFRRLAQQGVVALRCVLCGGSGFRGRVGHPGSRRVVTGASECGRARQP
jgi:hypothetical protein